MSAKGKTAWAIAGFMLMAAMTGTIWFYSSGFTLKEPTYIFIDRDDNIDSVSHKIAKDCKPQSIRAFRLYSMLSIMSCGAMRRTISLTVLTGGIIILMGRSL